MITRKELEVMVTSYNKILKTRVQTMNITLLLRNVHPDYRSRFAYQLWKERQISRVKAMEFTNAV
jgi:hypothetical protein